MSAVFAVVDGAAEREQDVAHPKAAGGHELVLPKTELGGNEQRPLSATYLSEWRDVLRVVETIPATRSCSHPHELRHDTYRTGLNRMGAVRARK